jgi:ubiquitin carboxyl-terminal hydrolase 10
MCFANAVLQILVYCQPFHRLFTELGKYLPGPVVGSSHSKKPESKTPLVDSAIQFLAEFNPPPPRNKRRGKEDPDKDDDPDSFMPVVVYDAMKEKKRFDNMRVR